MKLVDCTPAISSLIDKVAGEAMVKLPCLAIGTQDEIRQKLSVLAKSVVDTVNADDECSGAWDTDGVFVVTVECDANSGEVKVGIALCLGETKIK